MRGAGDRRPAGEWRCGTMPVKRTTHSLAPEVQKEVAELQNTCLTLQTRNEELQKVHDKLWKVTEEKNQKEKENQVMRYELKQLGLQLQQLLSFFTETADAVLEQEDSAVFIPSLLRNTKEQLNDNPEENEVIPQFTWIQRVVFDCTNRGERQRSACSQPTERPVEVVEIVIICRIDPFATAVGSHCGRAEIDTSSIASLLPHFPAWEGGFLLPQGPIVPHAWRFK
ncbi:plectin-like [Tachysurus ichikawai]